MSKIFKNFIVILGLMITTSIPVMAQAPELTWQQKVDQMTVKEMIDYIAPQFTQDPYLIKKIMMCESGLQVLPHDGGRGVNATGIHDTTFNGWLPKYEKLYEDTLNIDSMFDQIKMMSFAFSQGESYRDDWTTYVAYKKGGTWTFYSNLMGRWYTVRCA